MNHLTSSPDPLVQLLDVVPQPGKQPDQEGGEAEKPAKFDRHQHVVWHNSGHAGEGDRRAPAGSFTGFPGPRVLESRSMSCLFNKKTRLRSARRAFRFPLPLARRGGRNTAEVASACPNHRVYHYLRQQ